MPTRTITTKKFSSETTNATPANDDRILFSDTSDGGAPKDATIDDVVNASTLNTNATSAWSSYTPVVAGSSGSGTVSVLIGKYKQIGKTVFVAVKVQITNKNTLSGDVAVSLPVLPNNSIYLPINGYCVPNAANPSTGSRADAEIDTTTVKFKKSFNIAWLQWSDITNTDWIVFNGTYEAS